jgi:hypothetical protein
MYKVKFYSPIISFLMHLRDMKYISFKHQRENKQNSDKTEILLKVALNTINLTK